MWHGAAERAGISCCIESANRLRHPRTRCFAYRTIPWTWFVMSARPLTTVHRGSGLGLPTHRQAAQAKDREVPRGPCCRAATTGGESREDRTRSLRLSVHNRAFAWKGFSPRLSVVHAVRDTNAQLYDYRRTGGELSFARVF